MLILELSSLRIVLTNVSFFVSYAALATDDVLNGFPVRQHLGIDSRTLLEHNRPTLDATDFSAVLSVSKACGSLGLLMIARLQPVCGSELIDDETPQPKLDFYRPPASYFAHKFDEDPLPDPN